MDWSRFTVVGENIHCTRVVKQGGARTRVLADGSEAVCFHLHGEDRNLPIPGNWGETSPVFARGQIKHAALGIWQAMHGRGEDGVAGRDYLCWMARCQIEAGAHFLDVNVDEFSNDEAAAVAAMTFLVDVLGERFDIPLSIDSSNPRILAAGLAACQARGRRSMLNSVSLEREEAVGLVAEYGSVAIVSAAGREGLPADTGARMENLSRIIALLDGAGIARERLYLDPLVLPISTDPLNGQHFLEAVAQARASFAGVHIGGGFSNVSFGMPQRKLLNMVFTWLCAEAGADSGIIDPVAMPVQALAALDPDAAAFRLARDVLTGADMFGMEFIAASRDGRL